ncbi:MAG: glycosyltransferase, partial [Tangfeifania sp.]
MKISLIIVTYNRPKALEVILKSILIQTEIPHEVIIADDGSGPETAKLIAKYRNVFPCKLKHVWQEDNGFRAAKIRN